MAVDLSFKMSMAFTYGEAAPMGPGIVRIVANNPSAYTFKGTNTYLAGSTALAVIDPGPDDANHITAILAAAGSRPITHILVTHAHRDHVDGVAALKAATGATTCGFGRAGMARVETASGPTGTDFIDYDFMPDLKLGHGDAIDGRDWTIRALHTPGHAPDHLCFALEGRAVTFTGDHVMSWNTSVVAPPEGRMSDYMRSLELLLERRDTMHLPGHGGRIAEPQRTAKAYLLHRRWREQAVLDAIRRGGHTVRSIVPVIYRDIEGGLETAAILSVLAHCEHLIERGLITAPGLLPPAASSLDSALLAV